MNYIGTNDIYSHTTHITVLNMLMYLFNRSFPDKLMDVLQANQETTLAFLEENSAGFGSYMTQPPSAETSKCILAFLLAWQITLRQFRDSEAGHRASFANFFRKRNMIGPLLTILFSILPHDKGHLLSADCIIVEGISNYCIT